MNDPGMDQPLKEAANDLEDKPFEQQEKLEKEEEQDFLDPSRWWFASTACPLIAGTFGPMANAFSICALAVYWREYIPIDGTEAHGNSLRDPKWLTAVNSISLAMALIANLALLLNMARRLRFAIAQAITIAGWYLASLLLVALVAVCSSRTFRLDPPERHALTQAYYYAIMAATLYFIVATLMVFTVIGALRNHYPKEFRLTMVQRTLMMQTICFMGYLLIGACIYSYIEDWPFLDAVYWADFTLLTVGIGDDFTPKTHLGRSLLFPYAVGGILTVGLVIGSIRSLILDRGKAKMTARMIEKKREKVLDSADMDQRTIRLGTFHKISFSQRGLTEPQRREQEFHIMRKIQNDATSHRKWTALGVSTSAALILWLVGAVVFRIAERKQGWSYFVSLYFSYTSLLTIGYGDLQPTSNSGKPFFVLWSLLAVPTLTVLISNMGDTVVRSLSNLTNWAGSLTILPGDNGLKVAWRTLLQKFSARNLSQKKGFHTTLPGRPMPSGPNGSSTTEHQRTIEDHAMDRLSKYLEDKELREAREAGRKGDATQRDFHLYHYVLAREVRHLMKDVQASPPKEYIYNDWAWYLKLIGQDEANSSLHRDPPVLPDQKKADAKNELEYLGQASGANGNLTWSWLGTRSPLMGNKSEAEWLLEKLSARLEQELYVMHSGKRRNDARPPISFHDVVAKEEEREDFGSARNVDETVGGADSSEGDEGKEVKPNTSTGTSTVHQDMSHDDTAEGAFAFDREERSMRWE